MTKTYKSVWGLLLLAILTFSIYSFAVNGSFKSIDDEYSIVRNEKIQSLKNIPQVFSSSFFGDGSYYRPLVSLSFMKEYFFYKANPIPYYLDNILLHIFNAFLVFGIIYQLTRREETALAVAFLFALHPIQWEAVSNIPGRAILLCAFYYFLSFFFFLLADRKKVFSYFSLVAFILALLSKESGGVLPLLLLSFIFIVYRRQKREETTLYSIAKTMGPYFAIMIVYLIARKAMGMTNLVSWESFGQHVLGFISFLNSVIIDIRLLLFPVDLYFDRSHPVIPTFSNPGIFLTLIFFAILAIYLWKKRYSIMALEAFFITWFFIELLPVSQIVTKIGVQANYISSAEHFLYTPSVGFFALIVLLYERFRARNEQAKWLSTPVLRFGAVGLIAFLALLTIQYSIYSSNEIAMFERTLQINPTNTRIRNSLALAYAKHNRYDLAEKNFRMVLEAEPYNERARIGLGKALCDQGKYWEGIREYEKTQNPGSLKELLDDNVRSTLLFLVSRYDHMLKKQPQNARVYHSLGVVYSKLGNPQKAIEQYEKAISFDANLKDSVFNLASTYEVLGARDKAIAFYQQVLLMRTGTDPDDMDRISVARLGELAKYSADPRVVPQEIK